MSMRVMQAKYNARVKNQQWNSRTKLNGGPFAIGFTRTGVKQGACCNDGVFVQRAPSHQQSYGLYLKRATMGIGAGGGGVGSQASGGLASRVVDPSLNIAGNKGPVQLMLTYKRPQAGEQFVSSSHIDNVRSKALRCNYFEDCNANVGNGTSGGMMGNSQNPNSASVICYNGCGKNGMYCQDLGYLSASQQINKKLALRAGPGVAAKYESTMMNSSPDGGSCA